MVDAPTYIIYQKCTKKSLRTSLEKRKDRIRSKKQVEEVESSEGIHFRVSQKFQKKRIMKQLIKMDENS